MLDSVDNNPLRALACRLRPVDEGSLSNFDHLQTEALPPIELGSGAHCECACFTHGGSDAENVS
jgi:hypothetical protein